MKRPGTRECRYSRRSLCSSFIIFIFMSTVAASDSMGLREHGGSGDGEDPHTPVEHRPIADEGAPDGDSLAAQPSTAPKWASAHPMSEFTQISLHRPLFSHSFSFPVLRLVSLLRSAASFLLIIIIVRGLRFFHLLPWSPLLLRLNTFVPRSRSSSSGARSHGDLRIRRGILGPLDTTRKMFCTTRT